LGSAGGEESKNGTVEEDDFDFTLASF
jgi:hypothetical protein